MASVLLLLLAGCGGSNGGDGTEAAPEPEGITEEARIDRDGVLRIGINGGSQTLDPHKVTGATGIPLVFNLYDRVLHFDADGAVVAGVAEDWEFQGDALLLNLRDDVTFNDGTPLTAEAVKLSLERAKTVAGSTAAASLASVAAIEVNGDHELMLSLGGPAAELPAVLAGTAGVIINPAFIDSPDLALKPPAGAGSGPRIVRSFAPAERVVFERADEEYWDPPANSLRELTIETISASAPRMNALRSGQLDLINVRPDQIPEAEALDAGGQATLVIRSDIAIGTNGLLLRSSQPPFDRVEVRRALNLAVNRQEVAESLLNGIGIPTQQLWPEGHPGHVAELDETYPMEGDLEQARELLAEAGYPDGFSFTANVVSGAEPYNSIGQALQARFSQIGVRMQLSPIESSQSNGAWNAGGVQAWSHIVIGQGDPAQTVTAALTGGGNMCGDHIAGCRGLGDEGRDHRLDDEERARPYRELSELLVDQAVFVPVAFTPSMFLAKGNVLNVESMGMQFSALMDTRYLAVARDGAS